MDKKYKLNDYDYDYDLDPFKTFLHFSAEARSAAKILSKYLFFFDTTAFLYHLAFEMLIKAMLLYHKKEFTATHDLKKLLDTCYDKEIFMKEKDIINKLDDMWFHRYPMDAKLANSRKGRRAISNTDFDNIEYLYVKITQTLNDKYPEFAKACEEIQKNPEIKGDRIVMKKPKKSDSEKND
jgi:hypothetical protein